MSGNVTPILGEIRIVGFNFPPQGWAFCNGQLLPISQNQALYALLGTTYGGDGQSNFALPNLCGRSPLHFVNGAQGLELGDSGGEIEHTLTLNEMAQHIHVPLGNNAPATSLTPVDNFWANCGVTAYSNNTQAPSLMSPSTVGSVGGGQPHDNMSPFLVLNFIIALQGLFPMRQGLTAQVNGSPSTEE